MKKIIFILMIVWFITSVFASHNDYEEESECGLTNIGQCIVDAITGAITGVLNVILTPFVEMSLKYLKYPPHIYAFYGLWKTVVTIISVLYVFIISFNGLYLIFNSDSVEGRINAKNYLKKGILITILIPASFFIYEVLVNFTAGLSQIALNHVDSSFLYIDYNSVGGAIEETILYMFYLAVMFITVILFSIRYLFSSIAVIFFPVAILLYFFPFTQNYGKFMLHLILVNLFFPFFASITLAGFSQLTHAPVFQNLETLLATATFLIIDLTIVFFALFSIFIGFKETISFVKGGYEWAMTYLRR